MQLVGFSERATLAGVLDAARRDQRINRKYGRTRTRIRACWSGRRAADDVTDVAAGVRKLGLEIDDAEADRYAVQIGAAVELVTLALSLLAALITASRRETPCKPSTPASASGRARSESFGPWAPPAVTWPRWSLPRRPQRGSPAASWESLWRGSRPRFSTGSPARAYRLSFQATHVLQLPRRTRRARRRRRAARGAAGALMSGPRRGAARSGESPDEAEASGCGGRKTRIAQLTVELQLCRLQPRRARRCMGPCRRARSSRGFGAAVCEQADTENPASRVRRIRPTAWTVLYQYGIADAASAPWRRRRLRDRRMAVHWRRDRSAYVRTNPDYMSPASANPSYTTCGSPVSRLPHNPPPKPWKSVRVGTGPYSGAPVLLEDGKVEVRQVSWAILSSGRRSRKPQLSVRAFAGSSRAAARAGISAPAAPRAARRRRRAARVRRGS